MLLLNVCVNEMKPVNFHNIIFLLHLLKAFFPSGFFKEENSFIKHDYIISTELIFSNVFQFILYIKTQQETITNTSFQSINGLLKKIWFGHHNFVPKDGLVQSVPPPINNGSTWI